MYNKKVNFPENSYYSQFRKGICVENYQKNRRGIIGFRDGTVKFNENQFLSPKNLVARSAFVSRGQRMTLSKSSIRKFQPARIITMK